MKNANHATLLVGISFMLLSWGSPVAVNAQLAPDANTRALYHFDEPGGFTAEDSSFGGSWDGILLNGASRGASFFASGTSLQLDGVDDYASVSPDVLNNLPQGTIEAWVYVESLNSLAGAPIVSKATAAFSELSFGVDADGTVSGHIGAGPSVHTGSTVPPTLVPLQTWTQIALTWDDSFRRIYINNCLKAELASSNFPLFNNANDVQIGRHNHSAGPFFFHGRIEDVRISDVARDFADVTPPAVMCPPNISIGCSADALASVTFSATATDDCDPAPVVVCTPPSGSGFPVGTTTVTCTATDASGNQSTCEFSVTRAPLEFNGFLPPIGGADATGGSFGDPVRTFKMKSTIPVKFRASCGDSPVLTGIHTLQVVKYSNATTSDTPIDASPQDAATTGNQFRLADGTWHFNLDAQATGMSAGIWLLTATLSDGSQHSAWIQLK